MKRSRLVLLLCIFTAFVLWLLYTLSNEYSSYFRFPLEVETNLEGRTNLSMAENTLFLKGKARGFYIIRSSLRKRPAPVRLFVDQSLMREYPGVEDEFYVLSDDVHNLVNEALGADLLLENIFSDTIRLNYTRVLFKKVPVVFISDISYRPQYMSFNPPRIIPDSVLVYASASLLPLIDHVKTRKINLMELDQTVDGLARLEVPQGTRLSHKEISYELTVERYVELMFQVHVETRNVPFRKELLLLPDVAIRPWGIFPVTESLDSHLAVVRVEVAVQNRRACHAGPRVRVELVAPDGTTAAVAEKRIVLAPGEEQTCFLRLAVEHPRAWSVDDPQLYQVKTILLEDGALID